MHRRAAIALSCAVMLGVCAVQSHALAQRTSSLSWVRLRGTEDCISTQALAESVEQRVGHPVFVSASQADLSLEGHVERTSKPGAFVATLVVSDRAGRVLGRRVLRAAGDRCDALTPSLVLVIAIAVDPRAALPVDPSSELSPDAKAMLEQLGLPELSEERIRDELGVPDPVQPEPEPAPTTSTPAPAPAAPSPPAREQPAQAQPGKVELSARLSAEIGVLPHASLGLALGPTFDVSEMLALDLWLSALLPQTASVAADSSARFVWLGGGAAACARLGSARALEWRACAGARAGVVFSEGRGFDRDQTARGAWLEPTLYGGPTWTRGRWLMTGRLGGGVPLIRDDFRYKGRDGQFHTVHRASAVVARIELGAGIAF